MFYITNHSSILTCRKDITTKKIDSLLLENINISLKNATNLILKGKNGSGKTSLLNFLGDSFLIPNKNFNLLHLLFYLNWSNNLFLNIITIVNFKKTTSQFKNLSYGFQKFYLICINWVLIKKLYLFDEPFNGLDKYFLNVINSIYVYMYSINSIQIKSYHNNNILTNTSFIFLD